MADLPVATTTLDTASGNLAAGSDYCAVLGVCGTLDDITPRVFTSTKALLATHGYCPAVDYCAWHFAETGRPVLFVGLPIVTASVIGQRDNSGNTGTSVVTVAADTGGIMDETEGVLTVVAGGTIGTDSILLSLSLDGGRTSKTLRLGTETSYTIPYVGLVLAFAAGTLVAGDVAISWRSTEPRWDQAGLAAARTALAAQRRRARTWLVVGDLTEEDDATDILTETNGYETENSRYILAQASVRDSYRAAVMSRSAVRMTGAATLTFAEVGATGDTITRSIGSWLTDGFLVGYVVTVTDSLLNNVTGPIAALSATVLTLGTTDLAAEVSTAGCHVVGSPGLTFAEVGASSDTITRTHGSWVGDGFKVGDVVTVDGTASNEVSGAVAALSATVLTFGTTDLAAEVIGSHNVSITAPAETDSAFMASTGAEFDDINDSPRIDLWGGRGRKLSYITGYRPRRPVLWAASIREYQHDVHIPCWRKADGALFGVDLEDADGTIVEHDESLSGGLLAARISCARTWPNGPAGTFVALALTRALESSILARAHNMLVANLACTTVQTEAENAIGQVLVLNDDGSGTATEASLGLIEERVNSALVIALLQSGTEGPRASVARWTASRADVLNVPGAELNGILSLELNGTLEKITTLVSVNT